MVSRLRYFCQEERVFEEEVATEVKNSEMREAMKKAMFGKKGNQDEEGEEEGDKVLDVF